jgi:hypothetical protein
MQLIYQRGIYVMLIIAHAWLRINLAHQSRRMTHIWFSSSLQEASPGCMAGLDYMEGQLNVDSLVLQR